MVCAHCGSVIHQGGLPAGNILRACSDTMCRKNNDGGWNLIARMGKISFAVALPRRIAQIVLQHEVSLPPEAVAEIRLAAGDHWRGPGG